ncbi:UNC-50, partial [Paraphysoderma sedebokerense]
MNYSSYPRRRRSSTPAKLSQFLKRVFKFPHMDFELAASTMLWLLVSPKRVYRNIYYHKQTKNQWSRDDPAFVVLLSGILIITGIAWGVTYHYSFLQVLNLIVRFIAADFLLFGFIIAFL